MCVGGCFLQHAFKILEERTGISLSILRHWLQLITVESLKALSRALSFILKASEQSLYVDACRQHLTKKSEATKSIYNSGNIMQRATCTGAGGVEKPNRGHRK